MPQDIDTKDGNPSSSSSKEDEVCEYYPCHFEGQTCTYCYCPFYPCMDYELGFWVIGWEGNVVWSCIDCHLLHLEVVDKYYSSHKDATLSELKQIAIDNGLSYTGNKSGRKKWTEGKGALI
ncbi:MAG: cysteine-rich small domain-containing protein [Methermicoccaceae archaeon]